MRCDSDYYFNAICELHETRSCDQNHPPLTAGEYSMGQCSFVWFDTESQPKPRNFEIRWVLDKVAVASLWGA